MTDIANSDEVTTSSHKNANPSSTPLVIGILLIVALAGFLIWRLMGNQSEDTPESTTENPQPTATPLTTQASFQGITFDFANLATAVVGQSIVAQPFTEPQPGGSGNPDYIQFQFDPIEGEVSYPPMAKVMYVYPTDQYVAWLTANSFDTANFGPAALEPIINSKSTTPGTIPVAPVPTGSQVYQAQVQYPGFSTGSGVRFITSYAQDVSPITSQNLVYSYQGLTSDGKYWVSLFYPVTTELLPSTSEEALNGKTYDEFAQNYATYKQELTDTLNNAQADDFTPNLDDLDAMIKSISVPTEDIFTD